MDGLRWEIARLRTRYYEGPSRQETRTYTRSSARPTSHDGAQTVCGDSSCGKLLGLNCGYRPNMGAGMQRTDALQGRCFCTQHCASHQRMMAADFAGPPTGSQHHRPLRCHLSNVNGGHLRAACS